MEKISSEYAAKAMKEDAASAYARRSERRRLYNSLPDTPTHVYGDDGSFTVVPGRKPPVEPAPGG